MFARTMLRSCTRNGLLTARHPPRILPKAAIPRPLFFSQQPRLLRQERPSPPPLRRIQIRAKPRYGYTQEEINNAKPLITNETLAGLVRSSQFRWLLLLAASGGVIFYYSNLEIVPVSGRQRFNCYSDASVEAEGLMAYNAILREMEGRILPTWDPRYRMVSRVMKRLIPASGLADANWEVHVVQNQSANAFVIPGGKVFVFTGILPIVANDDGLAAVLGHEIAHNVARHAAEGMSRTILFVPLRWSLMLLDSLGITMGLGHVLASVGMELGIMRPASRKQESEADYIGLMMMARSCYNPKEAVKVWERMEKFQAQQEQIPEWLSTHPSNSNRIEQMSEWLAKAEDAREQSDCASTIEYSNAFGSALQSLLIR